MKLNEVVDNPIMWMANRLVQQGHGVTVDLETTAKVDGVEVHLMPSTGPATIMGELIKFERRGQAFGEETVVMHVLDTVGEDEWYYFFEASLQHMKIEKRHSAFFLVTKDPT